MELKCRSHIGRHSMIPLGMHTFTEVYSSMSSRTQISQIALHWRHTTDHQQEGLKWPLGETRVHVPLRKQVNATSSHKFTTAHRQSGAPACPASATTRHTPPNICILPLSYIRRIYLLILTHRLQASLPFFCHHQHLSTISGGRSAI